MVIISKTYNLIEPWMYVILNFRPKRKRSDNIRRNIHIHCQVSTPNIRWKFWKIFSTNCTWWWNWGTNPCEKDDEIKLSMSITNIFFQKICLQIITTHNFQFCFVATTIAMLLPSCTQPTCIVLYFAKT